VPAGVLTRIVPLVAPAGTVATIRFEDSKEKAAATPLKVTEVTVARLPPSMKTGVPGGPALGENSEIAGVVTVKALEVYGVPAVAFRLTDPLVPFGGTTNVSCVSEMKVKLALRSFRYTPLAPVKPEPVTVTVVPAGPLVGLKPVIEAGVIEK
jgi:hypothetical protein